MKDPPDVELTLEWQGGLRFLGERDGQQLLIDGDAEDGPSPVTALLFALAGCMAVDVVHILGRMRTPAAGLSARLQARRAAEDPRRLVSVSLQFRVTGEVPRENLQRALDLSRDKYCSVLHSLRPDLELEIAFYLTLETKTSD